MERIQTFFGEKASIISEFDRHPSSLSERISKKRFKDSGRRPLSLSDSPKAWDFHRMNWQYIKP